MKKLNLLLAAFIVLSGCTHEIKQEETKKAKNIILMIGDGMGITQVYGAMSVSKEPLVFEKFKNIGFHKTYSASDYITDSGAGGTALATGTKTNNLSVGVDTAGVPLKSILHYAEENKLATGLVSTSSILHATPASFIAHEKNRSDYENIARDFLDVDIDIFIGGGKKQFAHRKDSLNLLDSLKSRHYQIIDGLANFNKDAQGKFAVFTAEGHNPEIMNGRGDMLSQSTENAIAVLRKNENGFFLMVEGSQIDWGGHDRDIDYVVSETLDFEKAVRKAYEFAVKDGETLLIVTADHETGGLSLTGGELMQNTIEANFAFDNHTAVMVPVFAYGPGAENFGGIYENTDVFEKMMEAYGFSKE